jgi:hypothetical protein
VVFTAGMCGPHDAYTRYLKGFDLLMYDDYPFYTFIRGRKAADAAINEVGTTAANCVSAAHRYHKLGPIMVLQGFGHGVKDGPFAYRDPAYLEERAMFWDTVQAGVPMIVFWDDGFTDRWVGISVRRVVQQWRGPQAIHLRPILAPPPSRMLPARSGKPAGAGKSVHPQPTARFSHLLFPVPALST